MIPKKDVIKNHFFAIVVTFLLPFILSHLTVNIPLIRITMMVEKNIIYCNLLVCIAAEVDEQR